MWTAGAATWMNWLVEMKVTCCVEECGRRTNVLTVKTLGYVESTTSRTADVLVYFKSIQSTPLDSFLMNSSPVESLSIRCTGLSADFGVSGQNALTVDATRIQYALTIDPHWSSKAHTRTQL